MAIQLFLTAVLERFTSSSLLWVICVMLIAIAINLNTRSRYPNPKGLPLPPGPRPLPIIGNALDVPTTLMSQCFRKMTEKFGDIVYLDVLGQPMIILGSHAVASELLDKRSSNYSSRPSSIMRILAGWEWTFALMPYGTEWRRRRKEMHQFFHPNAVAQYQPLQQREALIYLKRLVEKPEDFLHHVRHSFASTIVRISYGIKVQDGDEYATVAEDAVRSFALAFVPGKFLVETFPSLMRIPSWFPGSGFKRVAAEWKKIVHHMRDMPFERVMEAMRSGTAEPCIAAKLMENAQNRQDASMEEERIIARDVAALSYAAGADTTISTVQTFFMAITCYPEVLRKARVELDAVVGPTRLPTFEDRASLPYITAIVMESMRWQSITPLGMAHRSLADDEYNGYLIPAGSVVIANLWAFSHNPDFYPDPDTFLPERFLKDGKIDHSVQDPRTFVFGYGRRICPGRYFAEASLFIMIACTLHTLDIDYSTDKEGSAIIPEPKMTDGVISYPAPFSCSIKPRSLAYESLIYSTLNAE